MAKWEIIEDNKFKKQGGGKASTERAAAVARFRPVQKPTYTYVPAQDATKVNIPVKESTRVASDNSARNAVVAAISKPTEDQINAEKENYNKSYDWTSDYMNSPMYKKMLTQSSANTGDFNNINNTRWSNFRSTPPLMIMPQIPDKPNLGGLNINATGQIIAFPHGFGSKGTYSHELSHATDRPLSGSESRIMPQSDKNYISQHVPTTFENSPKYNNSKSYYDALKKNQPKEYETEVNKYKDFNIKYIGEDTETRARLNAIRQGAQQNNLYDPFKQGVTPEIYNDKLKDFQFEKGDKSEFDPMQQLRSVYSDEEIMYMLNHISENKKENDGTELDNLPKAKNGLVIEDPMGQWAHPGLVTRIPSNQITMEGVNYPVLGISDRGHTQMMYPGEDYSFKGKSVTEYPMMQGGGQTSLKNQILNTRLPATNQPTLNPNFNRSTSTTSPLSLQVEGKKDYGVSLNKNGLNLSGGLNLEDKKPAFRAGIDYGKGNWSGNANYSTNDNNFEAKVGYNNNGFNAGAGYQRNNSDNSFNTNANYSNNGFNVGAGYQRNNNNNSFNANVGYDGDSPVSFDANYAYDKGHSFDTNVGLNLGKFSGGLNYGYNQEGDKAHNFGANANLGLGKNLNLSADANFDSNKNYQVNAGLKYNFQDGGEVNFTYAGENHRVYEKESPTGNGKGIEGHIMVNHPTENKGKWDTIDLTKITNGKVKTVAQGVASTKKWHKENPEYANGGQVSFWEILEDLPKAQTGILTPKDSLYHQRDKTIKYDLLRGGTQGNPLPQYSNTAYYNQFYKDSVEPKLKYYPTAMEKGDAGDFIFNTGKDPRVFAYQEYLRKTDPTNKTGWQDASGNWKDRKTLPSNFDSTYDNTIGKFSENERRVAINNGRDWYYKNTYKDPKDPNTGEYTGVAGVDYWSKAPDGKGGFTYNKGSDGTMSPAYAKTWYGRIWNNNDFKEFDPNNPKFTPPAQKPGQSVALPAEFKKGGQVFNWQIIEDLPKAGNGLISEITSTLNPKNWGVTNYSDKGSFDSAYSTAKKAGEQEFMFNNKRYNTKYAGTPRQEVGRYGVNGQQINPEIIDQPAKTTLFPSFYNSTAITGRYLPGHIGASVSDGKYITPTVNYSSMGNEVRGVQDAFRKDEKTYYSYGVDPVKFTDKAKSLPLTEKAAKFMQEKSTPSDWNLFTNNCADNVCDAFGIPRNKGLQTPSDAMDKIKEKYPTQDVTGRTYSNYVKLYEGLQNQPNEKILSQANNILGIASSPEIQKSGLSNKLISTIQGVLAEEGYDLSKSLKQKGNYDGVLGDETKKALQDYQSKKTPAPKMAVSLPGQSVALPPQFQKGGKTNIPIYVNNPNDPRLQMYSDSLYNSNLTKNISPVGYNLQKTDLVSSTPIKPTSVGTAIYPNNVHGNMKPSHWDNYVTGVGFDKNSPEYSVARFTPPTQPYILKLQDHAQEQINMPTMSSINSGQQISQPIINIPTVIPPQKDYVTMPLDDGYRRRNPENGQIESQTYKIDKVTGKTISEPEFKSSNIKIVPGGYKNGGKTKKSNWQIIEY